MWGGPAQQDTWDLKPDAPAEIRGEFKPIATKVPGIQICEHFPQLAQRTDKLAIVRSMTHTDVDHTTVHALSADRPAAADGARLARRLAAHRRGAVAPGPRARSAAAVRVDAAEAGERRAALRRAKPRPVRRLAGPGVRSAVDRRQSGRAPTIASATFDLPPEISVARLDSRRALLARPEPPACAGKATTRLGDDGRHVAAGLRPAQLGHRQPARSTWRKSRPRCASGTA